jgi:hypothetical protein
MAAELGWDDARLRAERAVLDAFFAGRSAASGLLE